MDIRQLLDQLRTDRDFMRRVAAWERIPPRPARTAPFPTSLDLRLVAALKSRGIESLYTHQAQAIEAVARGEHISVVTSTASGKTLCYNLPVLNALLKDPATTALYLFPTKALAQDQLAALRELIDALDANISAQTYDGDTPRDRRRSARNAGGVIITNPDMLHTGILPHHTQWATLFENLHFVVLDELHTYRGVFGSHLANVIRRLKRIAAFYGSAPQFICCSATIANPLELAQKLLDLPPRHSERSEESLVRRVETLRFAQGDRSGGLTLIDDDGAPRGEKHFILLNPPIVDKALGQRRSYTLEARDVAARFLSAGIQTIVFARARLTTEVLLTYLRDAAGPLDIDPQTIRGYRGGYLAEERRTIERGLRDGSVRGVAATNALELGVDIGQLGAAVLAGYPGTIASAWQQAGRAGRRNDVSAAVLVASASPLDQYLVAHPRYFFERSPEHGLIAPDNLVILLNHLKCAAFELPFAAGERFGSAGPVDEFLDVLAEEGLVHRSGENFRWIADAYPANGLSLRSGTDETIAIISRPDRSDKPVRSETTIGQMDRLSAPVLIHEGAIYLHEGQQFWVEQLDWEAGQALVKPVQVDYYTDASSAADVRVLEEIVRQEMGATTRSYGEVLITSLVTGYRKIKLYTHQVLGWGEVTLPEQKTRTTAYWLNIAKSAAEKLVVEGVLLLPNDYGPSWNKARDAARERDGYRCRSCNASERDGRQHDVHHLRPFREFGYARGANDNDQVANALDNLITLCPACHHRAETARGVRTSLGGLAHALGNLAPLYLMCDPRDIGIVAEQRSVLSGLPSITLYERVPAGIGFSQTLYELHDELLKAARDLIAACPCDGGCPACIGPGAANPEAKQQTIKLLDVLIGLP